MLKIKIFTVFVVVAVFAVFGSPLKIFAQTVPGCTATTKFSATTGKPCLSTATTVVTASPTSPSQQADTAQGAKLVAAVKAMIARMQAAGQKVPSALRLVAGDYRGLFTKTLTIGSNDAEVKLLQQFLNWYGFSIAKTGTGSNGKETTYFGPATAAALAKFQTANGVKPANGVLGSGTRTVIESLSK